MPLAVPPADHLVQPALRTVPNGSLLWRVTRGSDPDPIFRKRSGQDLLPGAPAEGRFDASAEEPYPCCYAGLDDLTALAEALLRDHSFTPQGRVLPHKAVEGRILVALEAARDLRLISLFTTEDLARARQDAWLVHADRADYGLTAAWGHWLRRCVPEADGILWRSKRHGEGRAVVLFGDRCADGLRPWAGSIRSLDGPDLEWLNRRLSLFATYVLERPERPVP